MFSEKVTLVNPQGFHMRPASLIVAEVGKYDATVTIVRNGSEIPGNSLMAMMAAGIKCGQDVYNVIRAGADATGTTSGVMRAEDPEAAMEEMISAVRRAWDETHKK